jgi:hypothetical protein
VTKVVEISDTEKQRKNKRSKKRKKAKERGGLWKVPQLWKSAKESVAFGSIFLMRIPHKLLGSLLASTLTTSPTAIN